MLTRLRTCFRSRGRRRRPRNGRWSIGGTPSQTPRQRTRGRGQEWEWVWGWGCGCGHRALAVAARTRLKGARTNLPHREGPSRGQRADGRAGAGGMCCVPHMLWRTRGTPQGPRHMHKGNPRSRASHLPGQAQRREQEQRGLRPPGVRRGHKARQGLGRPSLTFSPSGPARPCTPAQGPLPLLLPPLPSPPSPEVQMQGSHRTVLLVLSPPLPQWLLSPPRLLLPQQPQQQQLL